MLGVELAVGLAVGLDDLTITVFIVGTGRTLRGRHIFLVRPT